MTDERDAKIAELLAQARAELQDSGRVDTTVMRAQTAGLADELADLMKVVERVDAAVGDWRDGAPTSLARSDETQVAPPRTLGRYLVQSEISSGGMGTVYKALDPQLHRTVAVKVPRFGGAAVANSELRQRFLREARAAAVVRHPHVCPIYDVGEQGEVPFAVMACIEGPTLADLLQSEKLDVPRAIALFRKIAQGLEAVHAQKITHRDLKPRNVLLDAQGEPYLTDFGLSRPEEDGDKLTLAGTLVGTLAYMAPEQVEGKNEFIGPQTDVYGLGVVLYQMLTGRLPFEGAAYTLMHKITRDTPPPPSSLRPELDPAYDRILVKAMARLPSERYATVAEFSNAVLRLQPGDEPKPVSSNAKSRRVVPRNSLVVAGLIFAALLIAGITITLRTRNGEVTVKVNEEGAKVRVIQEDGKIEIYQADKPKLSIRVVPGKHRLEVEKDGFRLYTESFTIARAGRTTVEARLEPLPVVGNRDRQAAEWIISVGGNVQVFDGKGLGRLKTLPLPASPFEITKVDLAGSHFAENDLARLQGLALLNAVDLSETAVTDAGLLQLRDLPELRDLVLTRIKTTGAGFRNFDTFPKLLSIWAGGCPVEDESLEHVGRIKKLRVLQLEGTRVTDAGLKHLRALTELRELHFTFRPITDVGIEELVNLRQLEILSLVRARVTDQSLAKIKNFAKLRRLFLNETLVTDAGMPHLQELRELERLTLNGTKITDEGLKRLHQLTKLQILGVGGTGATPDGVEQLKKALPHCRVD